MIHQDGGRSRYIGSVHWASTGDQLAELKSIFQDNYDYGMQPNNSTASADTALPLTEKQRHFLEVWSTSQTMQILGDRETQLWPFAVLTDRLLEGLPNKKQCDLLFRSYISRCNVIFMLSQISYLHERFQIFYEWYDSGRTEPYREPTFIPLLWAVLYGGTLSMSMKVIQKHFPGETRVSLSNRQNHKVIECLNAMSFLRRPHLHGLIAYIIVETMSAKEEEPMITQLSFSLIVQIAQNLGLHREPLRMGLDVREAELRRRVWWHIVFHDTLGFFFSSLPPIINWSFWDVRPVSEVKDSLFGSQEAQQYLHDIESGRRDPDVCDDPINGGIQSHVSSALVLNRGKHVFTSYMNKLAQVIQRVKSIDDEDFRRVKYLVEELDMELSSRIDRIPDTIGKDGKLVSTTIKNEYFEFIMNSYGILPRSNLDYEDEQLMGSCWLVFHTFSRKWLRMLVQKAWSIAYKPFLRDPSSQTWEEVSKTVLPNCYGYIENFIDVVTNPLYQPFHWAWPGCHQPLHSIMILLVDLYQRPTSDTATHSRILIDKAFELTTPDGGISTQEDGVLVTRQLMQGGQAAWRTLRVLREKAWRKAGFDPEIIWSSGSAKRPNTECTAPTEADLGPSPLPGNEDRTPSSSGASNNGGPERMPAEEMNELQDFDWSQWDETFGTFGQYMN